MDESQFSRTTIGPEPDRDQPQHRWYPGRRPAHRRRIALAAVSILGAVALLVSVWFPLRTTGPSRLGNASLTPFATFTAVPLGPTATPVLLPTPLPVAGLLGAPPRNCPAAPALDTLHLPALGGFSGPVQMSGGAPVWAVQDYFPQRFTDLSPSSPLQWPSIQFMWEIGPHNYPTVTVRAFALQTGEPAWWGLGGTDTPQVPVLVMNPARDFPTADYWIPYRTLLFITHAGCYELQVTWSGGSWYTIFAAGQTG
jgi:hypothetical protein